MGLKKIGIASLSILGMLCINLIFYVKTFTSTLSPLAIAGLVLATSFFELLVFYRPELRARSLAFVHALLFFLLSSSKVMLSMYIMYYGNSNIFSRSGQAGNLSAISEYFLAQVNLPNVLIVLLSLFAAVLLFLKSKYRTDSERRLLASKELLYSAVSLYLLLALILSQQADFEYYRAIGSSFLSSVWQSDIIIDETYAENFEKEKASNLNLSPLFRNYGHKNQYTGIGKDKNILIIQVESLQNAFINRKYKGREITPNLNRLIKKSFYFTDYFEMLGFGNSSDAEYVSLHSAYSTVKNGAYEDFKETDSYGLPKIMKSKSYLTNVMHGNTGEFYNRANNHPSVGFDHTYYGEFYQQDEIIGMGLSDKSFFRQSLPIFEQNKDKKTLNFMITLTCHAPYYMPGPDIVFTGEEIKDTSFERYLNAVYYTDVAIGDFLKELEARGILQNTVVAIYGDHHAFTLTNPEEKRELSNFIGHKFDYDEMLKIPLIIYVPGYEKEIVCEHTGSQLDFLPTMMNIMGWNDTVTPMFGVDLLDDQLSEGNVIYPQTYMLQGSYITKDYFFEQDREDAGKGRLVDRKTREELQNVERDELSKQSEFVIKLSNYLYYKNRIQDLITEFKAQN